MKKILLIIFLLPFVGFGQTVVDLASWALTANGNMTTKQAYITQGDGSFTSPQNPISYNATTGASITGWNNGGFEHYRYFEISITPTAGNTIMVSNLLFQQANTSGNLRYIAKYYVAENSAIPVTSDFFNNASNLITEESIAGNPTKNVVVNQSVNSSQKLIIRFYSKGNDYNSVNWRILANSLKFTGYKMAPLNGPYIIGSAAGANFSSLKVAVNSLNSLGVSGPVTFFIDENQTVTDPITINQFTGASLANMVTIKPNLGKDITIKTVNLNSDTGCPAVLKFNGSSFVTIDGSNSSGGTTNNLTLLNDDYKTNVHRSVVWIASNGTTGSSNITVKNSNIKFTIRNGDSFFFSGIYSGNNGLGGNNTLNIQESNANNSNITIKNNQTINVKDAIYINGNSSTLSSGWKIEGNSIGSSIDAEKPFRGIYVSNASSYEIFGNTISGIKNFIDQNNDCAAVALYGKSSGKIYGNKINDIVNTVHNNSYFTAGILLKGTGANDIYNNFISKVYVSKSDSNNYNYYNRGHGIFINSGSATNVYFNTIVMSGAVSGTTATSCLYIQGGSAINIKNNIFVNNEPAANSYAVFKNGGTVSSIGYNDYYVANAIGKFLNRIGETPYTSIAGATTPPTTWNTNIGDSNSIIFLPKFMSVTDLHLSNGENALLKAGTPITGITTDIDGDIRATIPYMGADEIKCTFLTTWKGVGWVPGAPTSESKVVFAENYNEDQTKLDENKDIEACTCEVKPNFKVVIKTGRTLKVINEVKVAATGSLTFENNASLVQVNDLASNSGSINYHRHTTPVIRYDFTYWSSPVVGQILKNLSPKTLYDKFYSYNSAWVIEKYGAAQMTAGRGYSIRAPQSFSTTEATNDKEPVFIGVPNNGVIKVENLKKDGTYLLGNPYPSAIDANQFLDDNSAVLEGTIYFWTHNSPPVNTTTDGKGTGEIYRYNTNDYASYNRSGGVRTTAKKATTDKGNIDTTPNGKIAAGQGFFSPAKADGTVVFKNKMRLFPEGYTEKDNSQFFKVSTTSKVSTTTTTSVKNRVWLNLTNSEGAFKQALIGYIEGATNDYEGSFDGVSYNGNQYVDFYSVNNDLNLTIQGRALPFEKKDSVSLGYKSTIKGDFQISIDHTDGALSTQDIFLEDKVLKVLHDLKKEPYTFAAEVGTFNSRFVLRYVDKNAIEIIEPEIPVDSNATVLTSVQNGEIKVNSSVALIDKVIVYDLAGRKRYQNMKVTDKSLIIRNMLSSHQVLVVKTTLENGETITSKIVY